MPEATIRRQEADGFPVFAVSGYFDEDIGQQLLDLINVELLESRIRIALDLGNCTVVNSLGISKILEIACHINEDYGGMLVISQVKPVVFRVFTIAGVLREAKIVDSLPDALNFLKGS